MSEHGEGHSEEAEKPAKKVGIHLNISLISWYYIDSASSQELAVVDKGCWP